MQITIANPTVSIQRRDYNKLAIHVANAYKAMKLKRPLKRLPILAEDAAKAYKLPKPTKYQTEQIFVIARRILTIEQ